MNKEKLRMFLWVALISVGFLLYTHWEQEHASSKISNDTAAVAAKQQSVNVDVPEIKTTSEPQRTKAAMSSSDNEKNIPQSRLVTVKTDVFEVAIDLQGGDIVSLILSKYPKTVSNQNEGYPLLSSTGVDRYYVVQSGLLHETGPDSQSLGRALYKAEKPSYILEQQQDKLIVNLFYATPGNVKIIKRFSFEKNSYLITVEYLITNNGVTPYTANFYGRIKRTAETQALGFMGMRTYTGVAVNTPDKAYYKISFDDMKKSQFNQNIKGGWAAMIEHYFTTAWIPDPAKSHIYSSERLANDAYGIRFISDALTVLPGESKEVFGKLYAGPEITEDLKAISPGLDLTVDYGVLWPICVPIFWILKNIYSAVGNWGIAIILTTLIIKLLFFKLSASSYRSMGNMRKLQPKIESLKQKFGDDKQGFGQAVMGLYKKEKVNPLGGCLPILVQIPVFIALYYVLLESVELRHAPFFLWINDLSSKDPFYVLPILMGLSMIIQQKLSPAPPDPVQAKVMMVMPIVFTFLFIQFPSGLVLYWVVNNILSIAQQWVITKKIEATNK